jgi:hypothetical protein
MAALMAEIRRAAAWPSGSPIPPTGAAIESEPHLIHTDADGAFGPAGWQEWMAFIRDTEGNLTGLASRHAPGEPADARRRSGKGRPPPDTACARPHRDLSL